MLRALGAQIEKTTNREACRDLSGRRLRDVNHEKEWVAADTTGVGTTLVLWWMLTLFFFCGGSRMAEWLKKQTEREAEKEQRRLDRLQRKLSEPKHQFTDPQYQQQCHDLSERLEDSVLLGEGGARGDNAQTWRLRYLTREPQTRWSLNASHAHSQ